MTGERKEEQHVQRLGGTTDAAHTENSSDAGSVVVTTAWTPSLLAIQEEKSTN